MPSIVPARRRKRRPRRRPAPKDRRATAKRPVLISNVQNLDAPDVARGKWTCDPIGLLSEAEAQHVNSQLSALRRDTGAEVAVVLVEDITHWYPWETKLRGYGSLAKDLFDRWGIGRRGHNDGVLLMLFRSGRRVEVKTGAGVQVLAKHCPSLESVNLWWCARAL